MTQNSVLTKTNVTTIAALGPHNTFSEIAAHDYAARLSQETEVVLFPTIKRAFVAVGKKCGLGVLPIENMLDGYIPQVLDLLLHSRLTIIDEMLVPVRFSFVANVEKLDDVKRVFVQFVSQGQCSDFLDSLPRNVEFITTESNGDSFDKFKKGIPGDGAVVISQSLNETSGHLVVATINDNEDNLTRFIVIGEQEPDVCKDADYKTSLAIIEGADRPGMLSDILNAFATRHINLVSIMSRPTKESIGKYNFFIDIDGYARDPLIQEAILDIQKCGQVKLIGSFPKAVRKKTPENALQKKLSYPKSPWEKTKARSIVTIAQGNGAYANTQKALLGIDSSVIAGKRVLVKPNAGRVASGDSGVVTNPDVVAAVIDFCAKAGASHISVGDSPITGVDVLEVFTTSGMENIATERNCPLIDMDKRPPVELALENCSALDKIRVCADVFDFDIIISVPVMKMHMHTGVTLSIKNMKGCLYARSKVDLHMLPPVPYSDDKPLNVAIADMASVLMPHLSVIDGTIGMEGLGPSAGKPKHVDIVVVSTDAMAADSVACTLMGVNPRNIQHLRICEDRGYGSLDTANMSISPQSWQNLVTPFAPVPENVAIEFPNVSILDENSCSACQSTLLLFLKRYGDQLFDYFPKDVPLPIAIGKGLTDVPLNTICIGNCTRKFKDHSLFVSGCPPVASSILKAIQKEREQEG